MHVEQPITELWLSTSSDDWQRGLARYWQFIKPANIELEQRVEALGPEGIRAMSADEWFAFLRDGYFHWKYTAANRYATASAQLLKADTPGGRRSLDAIRQGLLSINQSHIRRPIDLVRQIPGLGTAGASGLLALIYPQSFGTVDQFVVKSLRAIRSLPEHEVLMQMNPEGLCTNDAIVLIGIMRRRAAELTRELGRPFTPRALDRVLWTYGRC